MKRLAIAAALAVAACSPCQYLYDGSTGPSARPYYKACKDDDGKVRVKCDSPARLPNPGVCE